jgi:hypothetical protein
MLSLLTRYEVEMAHQHQEQLRRKATLWHLAREHALHQRQPAGATGPAPAHPHAGGAPGGWRGLSQPGSPHVGIAGWRPSKGREYLLRRAES